MQIMEIRESVEEAADTQALVHIQSQVCYCIIGHLANTCTGQIFYSLFQLGE